MNKDEYDKTLQYLFGLEKFGMVFGLENITWLLNIIGNPHELLKTVHIAGTNGKGSTAAMLSCILREGGFKVGKYTSPHVVSFTERITINEEEIAEAEVVELTDFIRSRIEATDRSRFFTFFDFTTALAFEYFRRRNVDIAIMETGLGGRLDSTNVVRPLASVITNVDYDHMEQLGTTLEEIAREKAGIIKEGVPVVTGCEGVPKMVVEEKAGSLHAPVHVLGRDFSFEKTGEHELFYKGIGDASTRAVISLDGDHQLRNCAVVLCTAEVLASAGFPVSNDAVADALQKVRIRGRLEKLRDLPLILVDAAHNPHGIHALAEYIKGRFPDRERKILIFGVMKDKDYEAMIGELLPVMDIVIFTRPRIERALAPAEIHPSLRDALITDDVRSALEKAKEIATDRDMILVTGSFYTIGEAKTIVDEIF